MMPFPLVGQTSKVMAWYPTAIVHCYCKGRDLFCILILTGFKQPFRCSHCGKHYAIDRIGEDGHTIDVTVTLATPESQTPQ